MNEIKIKRLKGEERDSLCDIPNCPNIIDYLITGNGLLLHLCEYHKECEFPEENSGENNVRKM